MVIVSMMLCNATAITKHDKRSSELSNAPLR